MFLNQVKPYPKFISIAYKHSFSIQATPSDVAVDAYRRWIDMAGEAVLAENQLPQHSSTSLHVFAVWATSSPAKGKRLTCVM